MAQDLPLLVGETWYELNVSLANVEGGTTAYRFDFRWNVREEAYSFDMYEIDGTPIVHGVRVVLGMYLGRRAQHAFFRNGVLVAIDTSGQGREATRDDLGSRVVIRHYTVHEVMVGRGITPSVLKPSTEFTDG